MEEKKKECVGEELNEKEMEKVSGGCIFFHTWRKTGKKREVFEQNEERHSFGRYFEYEYKCADCGAIEWKENH